MSELTFFTNLFCPSKISTDLWNCSYIISYVIKLNSWKDYQRYKKGKNGLTKSKRFIHLFTHPFTQISTYHEDLETKLESSLSMSGTNFFFHLFCPSKIFPDLWNCSYIISYVMKINSWQDWQRFCKKVKDLLEFAMSNKKTN